MIPKECKRLAEVDFPIAEVSKHAAREKSIRHGHPSTLHLWWARRPLASSRAMLMALLLPDPCDEHCPDEFKKQACEILFQTTIIDISRIELPLQESLQPQLISQQQHVLVDTEAAAAHQVDDFAIDRFCGCFTCVFDASGETSESLPKLLATDRNFQVS